ncbi:MAG: hypothetical protein JSV68_06940 [Anaerolineaceae bacterium]|nr:MAG: hypothetical protein JSV68_06940 [Anaerolineaceae bacterium]
MRTNELPDLSRAAKILPWPWPLAALGAIVLLSAAVRWAEKRREALRLAGLGAVFTGTICLAFIPAVRLSVENGVADPGVRVLVAEIVKALTRGLVVQSIILVLLGAVAFIFGHRVID